MAKQPSISERFAASLADGLIEDYAHYARGEAAEVTDAVEAVTGTPPRDVASFARDHAAALTAAASR